MVGGWVGGGGVVRVHSGLGERRGGGGGGANDSLMANARTFPRDGEKKNEEKEEKNKLKK